MADTAVNTGAESSQATDPEVRDVDSLLKEVTSALDDQKHQHIFAIGGRLDVLDSQADNAPSAHPINLRWDRKNGDDADIVGDKATFPIPEGNTSIEQAFQRLLQDCAPATFGLGQKDVLDESYRKAGKMDKEDFCTNFTPYEHGIMYTVIQALAQSRQSNEIYRGLRAELYKLNIYSGPSGKFKSHVDTPRSTQQMGSLVVCLPVKHSGGQLAVRHAGNQTIFDWAPESSSVIQWAAFFSDCEHEVLDVTDGHRVTLTYNLFWTSIGPSSMADNLKSLDETSLHFFNAVKNLLACPEFLPQGGLVGFACVHAYPHTSSSTADHLPSTLKGLDMVVFHVLERLTSHTRAAVYLHDSEYHEQIRENYEYQKQFPGVKAPSANPGATLGDVSKQPILWEGNYDIVEDPAEFGWRSFDRKTHNWSFTSAYKRQDVTWLNHCPDSEAATELAVAYLAYGNEPSIQAYYSSAVLVAQLGTAADRLSNSNKA